MGMGLVEWLEEEEDEGWEETLLLLGLVNRVLGLVIPEIGGGGVFVGGVFKKFPDRFQKVGLRPRLAGIA